MISIIDSSTICGFSCGVLETSSERVKGGIELGTL